jgi:prolyl-tRNA synthetase
VGRLLACVAEEHHDELGLVWPVTVAPYQAHIVLLRGKNTHQSEEISEKLYNDLLAAGVEVLYDDREVSPGVKFNDADLIGLPVRITISERSISQGGIEMKLRTKPDKIILSFDSVISGVKSALEVLEIDIINKVIPVEYND